MNAKYIAAMIAAAEIAVALSVFAVAISQAMKLL